MKNLLLVAALVLVSSLALAQNSAVNISTINVADGILVEAANEGEWGPLAPGTQYTMTADGLLTPPNVDESTEQVSVSWLITAGLGANVTVSLILPQYYIGALGGRIPYSVTSESAGWFQAGAADVGAPFTPFDPRVPYSGSVGPDGVAIGVGGVVSLPSNLPSDPDDYVGTYILTATSAGL